MASTADIAVSNCAQLEYLVGNSTSRKINKDRRIGRSLLRKPVEGGHRLRFCGLLVVTWS